MRIKNSFPNQIKSAAKKFFSSFLYGLYLFLILEIAARIAFSHPPTFKKITQGEYVTDVIWRHWWIDSHRKSNPVEIQYVHQEYNPVRGWGLKPNIRNIPVYKQKFLNTNSRGIRGTQEFSYERIPGKARILLVGDSYTFGEEVSDNENYPHYLQKLMPGAEIINLGVGGYGYDQMLLYLQEEGVKYKPDIVLIPYLRIDGKRCLIAFRDFAKPYYVLKNKNLILKNVPVPTPEQVLRSEFWKSKLVDLFRTLHRQIQVRYGVYQKMESALSMAILQEMVDTTRSIGAVPMIVYIEGVRDTVKKKQMDEEDKAFFEYWQDQIVPCLYVLPYVNSFDTRLLRQLGVKRLLTKREYGHFSPRENSIVAYAIYDLLRQSAQKK